MVLKREAAAYRAWKEGVVHTTLNPKGTGAVRIHLIPEISPLWKKSLCDDFKWILHSSSGILLGGSPG